MLQDSVDDKLVIAQITNRINQEAQKVDLNGSEMLALIIVLAKKSFGDSFKL